MPTRRAVVLIPALFGTALSRGEEPVWPPTAADAAGFAGIDALLDPALRPGDVIRGVVGGRDGYAALIAALAAFGFAEDLAAADALAVWPYDWRQDLRATADRLAAFLDARLGDRDEIVLLAHGAGGLVARNMLESGRHARLKRLAKITTLITLATPHLGAPIALWRLLNGEGAATLTPGDFARLVEDPRYPALHQLTPAPQARAIWDGSDRLRPLSLYDAEVHQTLRGRAGGLNA